VSGEDEADEPKRRRSVGDAIGGWARRVTELVSEATGSPKVPDALEQPLAELRARRFAGTDLDAVVSALREIAAANPDVAHVPLAIGFTLLHQVVLGGRPRKALADAAEALGDALGPEPLHLLAAGEHLCAGEGEAALDDLRRAARGRGGTTKDDAAEMRLLVHLLGTLAQLRRGEEERALREITKARGRLPEGIGAPIREMILEQGIALLLAADAVTDAEGWARDALRRDEHSRLAMSLLARVLAAKGDRIGAHALLDELGDDTAHDLTRVVVGIIVGLPDDQDPLGTVVMRRLQGAPDDPERRRHWALAELATRTASDPDAAIEPALATQIVDALAEASQAAPPGARDRWLEELGHVALRLDVSSDRVHELALKRLKREEGTAPEELRIIRARRRIEAGDDAMDDFLPGSPPRFRADPDVGGAHGPDPLSPVRSPDQRDALLASQRALAAAQLCRRMDQPEAAQDLLVEALVEWPGLRRARAMLSELASPGGAARLEDLLARSTTVLAAVPNRLLGVSLSGVVDALSRVVAARERLARPLTIAIMGEFSAGKSTFVNALLGEAVAPMGVLPTTTTINVFRRGSSGGARVHYRDGRIASLAPGDVHGFLHGLDGTEAARIRHVEIERTGERMGEAAVVDTPGLNALDAFHEQVAREFLDEADAVVWLFSATRSGAATEVGMLQSLRAGGRQVLGVLNKVDTLDEAERTELADYLREQLGEVLVDVVPLCAREALDHRTEGRQGPDPFAPVEQALERNFLARARELKRSLTARRLGEALALARRAALTATEQLEARADAALAGSREARPSAFSLLVAFGEAIEREVLGVDDLLTRESLGLGVVVAKKGRTKGPLDPLDAEYLAGAFREGLTDALRRALAEVGRRDPSAGTVLDAIFVPWAQGHIEGLIDAGYVGTMLAATGDKIADGEAAMRTALREALRPLARAWAERARLLVREVDRARARADRASSSAPRAEALRLRASVVSAIDALRGALETLEETPT
jgi:GTP-binding protein EngB required for normal cell division